MRAKCRSDCPISLALEAFGDKWSLLILRDLILRGRKHYREFLTAEEKISTNILADRLARLEELGIVSKSSDPGNGKQYVYVPTEKGLDLLPILLELYRWSLRYDPRVDRTKPIARRLGNDTAGLIREFRAPFKPRRSGLTNAVSDRGLRTRIGSNDRRVQTSRPTREPGEIDPDPLQRCEEISTSNSS